MTTFSPEELDHFCNANHRERRRPCDLCFAQRRKIRDLRLLSEGKPTLFWQPFAELLK